MLELVLLVVTPEAWVVALVVGVWRARRRAQIACARRSAGHQSRVIDGLRKRAQIKCVRIREN